MKTAVKPSTLDLLMELEREMATQGRTAAAEALLEALNALTSPARGWLTTGQAADRLQVTIPTVKDWIKRGTITGRQVGSRWYVSDASVEKVLGLRQVLAEMDHEGIPTEEEIRQLTKKIRRQMQAQERRTVVG